MWLWASGCRHSVDAPSPGRLRSHELPCRGQSGWDIIGAEKASIDTTTTDQLNARLASGAPASVKWTIAGGQNDAAFGPGDHQRKWRLYAAAVAFARPGASPDHGYLAQRSGDHGKLPAHRYPWIRPGAYPGDRQRGARRHGTGDGRDRGGQFRVHPLVAGDHPGGRGRSRRQLRQHRRNPVLLTPAVPTPTCTATYTAPRRCLPAARPSLWWGRRAAILTPPRRCTFC